MRLFFVVLIGAGLTDALTAHANIYGVDTRIEAFESAAADRISRSIAIPVAANSLGGNAKGQLQLLFNAISSPDEVNLCPDERFADQPVAPLACTGFLVAPDKLVTAGHCVLVGRDKGRIVNRANDFCRQFQWLFDYAVKPDGSSPLENVARDRLVGCRRVIYAETDMRSNDQQFAPDFAIIELDRPLIDRPLLKWATQTPELGDALYSVGFPSGLPAKAMMGSTVIDASDPVYFRSFLDVFEGDSGAPVLNARDEVTGILVRGFPSDDYVTDPAHGCARPNRCDADGTHCLKSLKRELKFPVGAHIQRVDAMKSHLND